MVQSPDSLETNLHPYGANSELLPCVRVHNLFHGLTFTKLQLNILIHLPCTFCSTL